MKTDTLLRDAYAARNALFSGRDATIDAMSKRLGINRAILSAYLRLTYLAPDIVRDLIKGRRTEGLTPTGLILLCKDLPHDWTLQRALFGRDTA